MKSLRRKAGSVGALLVLCTAAAVWMSRQGAAAEGVPTFSKDVAPLFFKNCTNCHRPGEIAPMPLLTYAEARPWARSVAVAVSRGVMPPWHADPAHGTFLNDRRLSDADVRTLVAWAEAGAPEGDVNDLPAPPVYEDGWTMGRPDAVLSMQEDYPVPADGTIAYQYFEVPTNFTEDRWIRAMEVRAGNRAVVHHVIVYARPPQPPVEPGASRQSGRRPPRIFEFPEGQTDVPAGQTGGPPLPPEQRKAVGPNDRPAPDRLGATIGGFAPGQMVRVYQEGTAMRLPAGTTLIFQMHYTANGKATTDRTRVGVKFAAEAPQTEVHFVPLINGRLHIPAGDSDYRVDAELTTLRDLTLWSLLPHTHLRGKRWNYEVTYPDGRTETILAVPRYDFNWQTDYVFAEPLKLPRGTRLHATAWYDNSSANRSNPDPTKDVWWGDQTWEEMMYTALTFSVDRQN